ncbi:MAG TPA: helix-turn-helix transcriptional regulator [Beijerinckiaceae bacterium]|jgi:ribosome-binding protein aMBF1 (putative translation factor)
MAAERKNALLNLEKRLNKIPDMTALLEEAHAVLVEEENAASQVATLVRQSRKAAGLSQAALGQKLGVSQSRVSQLEQREGTFGASVVLLARIAAACGQTLRLSLGNNVSVEARHREKVT